tara:strand:+ start:540 stop:1283 length:744 start_codon:yes stop_codon:yes gene_type:complete
MILSPEKNKNLLATLVEFAYAEYGSALEMLAAAKAVNSTKLKVGYINHALDEYRHAALILKVLGNQINNGIGTFEKSYSFTPQHVVTKGYVDKQGFLIEKLNEKKFVEFVYSNEFLAKQAFDGLAKRIKDAESLKVIKGIMEEEKNHADDSLGTLKEIMQDEDKHWGYAKKYYENKFPESKIESAFFREKMKNRLRVFYLKNFKFLNKLFQPIINLTILMFGKVVSLLIIPDLNKDNLLEQNKTSII